MSAERTRNAHEPSPQPAAEPFVPCLPDQTPAEDAKRLDGTQAASEPAPATRSDATQRVDADDSAAPTPAPSAHKTHTGSTAVCVPADAVRALAVRAFQAPCMLDALVTLQLGLDELVRQAQARP